MNIKKMPNGRYRVQVYDEHGVRHRKTFDKKADAEAFAVKITTAKYERQKIKNNLSKSRSTFEQAVTDYWSNRSQLRPKTNAKYKCELAFIDEFRKQQNIRYVDEFTRGHADKFKQVLLANNASPKTINSYLTRLKGLFTEQVNRDNIDKNPVSHIKSVPLKRKSLFEREQDYYTEEEIKAFFSQEMEDVYRNAFLGLYLTGLRFEELANLTWQRIDLVNNLIKVRSAGAFVTKTPSAERDIPLAQTLRKILDQQVRTSETDYLFPSLSGGKLSERTMLTICKEIGKSAGIQKNLTLHKFRHTFTSLLSQYGISYEVREYLLGHKPSGSLTSHYTKQNPSKFHFVIKILEGILSDNTENNKTGGLAQAGPSER